MQPVLCDIYRYRFTLQNAPKVRITHATSFAYVPVKQQKNCLSRVKSRSNNAVQSPIDVPNLVITEGTPIN